MINMNYLTMEPTTESLNLLGQRAFELRVTLDDLEKKVWQGGLPQRTPDSVQASIVTGYLNAMESSGKDMHKAYIFLRECQAHSRALPYDNLLSIVIEGMVKEVKTSLHKSGTSMAESVLQMLDIRKDYYTLNKIASAIAEEAPALCVKYATGRERKEILKKIVDHYGHYNENPHAKIYSDINISRALVGSLKELKDHQTLLELARKFSSIDWYTARTNGTYRVVKLMNDVLLEIGTSSDALNIANKLYKDREPMEAYTALDRDDLNAKGVQKRRAMASSMIDMDSIESLKEYRKDDLEAIAEKCMSKPVSPNGLMMQKAYIIYNHLKEQKKAGRAEKMLASHYPATAIETFLEVPPKNQSSWITAGLKAIDAKEYSLAIRALIRGKYSGPALGQLGLIALKNDSGNIWDLPVREEKILKRIAGKSVPEYLAKGGDPFRIEKYIPASLRTDAINRRIAICQARLSNPKTAFQTMYNVKSKTDEDLALINRWRRQIVREDVRNKEDPIYRIYHCKSPERRRMYIEEALACDPLSVLEIAIKTKDYRLRVRAEEEFIKKNPIEAINYFSSQSSMNRAKEKARKTLTAGIPSELADAILPK